MRENDIIKAIGLVSGLIDTIVEIDNKKSESKPKDSLIGKYMIVDSGSHSKSLATNARSPLNGCLVEIISEPYAFEFDSIIGKTSYEVVKVRSVATNREYEVSFSESCLVEVE